MRRRNAIIELLRLLPLLLGELLVAGWIYEIKHNSYRMMARRDGAGIRLFSRNGND